MTDDRLKRPASPSVVVVGAGVSGCACAATLAANGADVTVVNSALDSVGQPGYGPVVSVRSGGWEHAAGVIYSLPPALRDVWLDASSGIGLDAPFFFVDRRMLSVETKRRLERLPGLKFRQALVTEVGLCTEEAQPTPPGGRPRAKMYVGTVFGEVI